MIRSAECARGHCALRLGQLGVADTSRAVRLGRDHQRPDKGHFPAERDLDVLATNQLEQSARIRRDLACLDVPRRAGDGEEFRVGRREGIQQGKCVVDARVAVDDQLHHCTTIAPRPARLPTK